MAHAAPFTLVPGDPGSQVLVHVPHSSRAVPPAVRAAIVLDDDALERELDAMTDAHTDLIADAAVARLGGPRPWQFVNRRSRLVVDPERFPDPADEEMTDVGMGAVYTATSTRGVLREPDVVRDAELTRTFFDPYAAALAEAVDDRLAAAGSCVIVDLHSYPVHALPYERHGADRRPEVCLGTASAHTPDWLVAEARTAFATLGEVVLDQPFRGTYVPLRHWGSESRVSSLMVELRRDTYAEPAGRDRVVAALAALLEALAAPQ